MGTVPQDYSTLNAAGMVNLKSVKSCTILNFFSNDDIRKALNVIHMIGNANSYRKRGENTLKMEGSQIPKIAFEYNPKGRKDVGSPRKRWAL
jgi:5-enolpyruvylshikimate-3-phosphate synthase